MNKNIEILSILFELQKKSISSNFIDGEDLELKYDSVDSILKIIDKYNIKKEEIGQNTIRINLRQFEFPVFFDKNNFLSNVSLNDNKLDIGILNYDEDEFLFFDNKELKSFNSAGIFGNHLIPNTYSYLKIKKIISSDPIADYFSEANREIIIISPTKGRLAIGYPMIADNLDINEDIENYSKLLLNKLESKEFSKFFKNELYDFLSSAEKEQRLKFLALKLKTIIEAANRNYEIYLSNFSFDQIRNEYDSRKQKYFDEVRSIVNKLSGYSIGLPISISAASFAAFKTIDSIPTYILIISSFIVFSIYFIFMIRHNKDDLETLRTDFEFDFSTLFQKEFFKKIESEKESFLTLQSLLNRRIDNLKIKIDLLFVIVILLNTSLIIILLIQIKIDLFTVIIVTSVLLSLFFYLYFHNIKSEK